MTNSAHTWLLLAVLLSPALASAETSRVSPTRSKHFAADSLRGTLARDHASRLVHFRGAQDRTYVAYLDHYHDVMVACYDHDQGDWLGPVRVDCAPIRDGHAAPAIFVDSKGFLHTFSARGAIRHCRSKRPEDITEWESAQLIGPQDKSLTYTYPVETPQGDLLLFYRLGGAGGNSPLVVSRSSDRSATWASPRILVDYGMNHGSGSVKIGDAVYDAQTARVHLVIKERDNTGPGVKWRAHYCQYDPAADSVFALNGANLGKTASREALGKNDCLLPAAADMALAGGRVYLLMRPKGWILGKIEDGRLAQRDLPTLQDAAQAILCIPAKDDWRIYGYRKCEPTTPYPTQGNLLIWRSRDEGATWDQGQVLVDNAALDHGLLGLNLVRRPPTMQKSPETTGPMILFQEAFGMSYGRELRGPDGSTFSDMQLRFNKKLYALNAEHAFVTRGTPFTFSGYSDGRDGPPAGQAPGPRASFQLR